MSVSVGVLCAYAKWGEDRGGDHVSLPLLVSLL